MGTAAVTDQGRELPLLLSGFKRGMGVGAFGGLLLYAAVVLRMKPEDAGPLLGVAAGMLAAMVGGGFLGGLVSAYLKLLRASKR